MKKILLVATVTGAIVFAGCKKDNVTPMRNNSWNESQKASGDSTIFPNDSIDFPQDSVWYPSDSLDDYYPPEDSSWVVNDSIDG